MGFAEKTNPNRPARAASGGEAPRETRGEDRPFSERCDPRHGHRPLTEEQREMVERFMPMARTLARRAGGKSVRHDELEAEAYAALVDAARTFDADRGVHFAVHARPRITGALRDYRRFLFHANWRGERTESPVFQRIAITDEVRGRVLGIRESEPIGKDLEVPEAVASILHSLPRPQADACRLMYVEGLSCTEAADAMGCSKGYLSRMHAAAMTQLRHEYCEAVAN